MINKRYMALVLVLVVMTTLVACAKAPQKTPVKPSVPDSIQETTEDTKPTDTPETTEPQSVQEITPETWGVTERWTAINGSLERFEINFPESRGFGAGRGLITEQSDGSVAMIGGQSDSDRCPAIDDISEVFPAYFPDVEFILEGYYGIFTDNYNYTIESEQAVIINDRQMHNYTGVISFDDPDGGHFDCPYVAYAVQLEDNGAYAYWLVLDDSEEPNQEQIAEHAYHMALTYRED